MRDLIANIKTVLDQNGSSDELLRILSENHIEWNKNNQKFLENTVRSYRNTEINEVVSAVIIYAFLRGDEAIDFVRKRGLFAYYVDGNLVEEILSKLLAYSAGLKISDDARDYLAHKYGVRWLKKYYSDCDNEIDKIIEDHEHKKKHYHINGAVLESNIVIELLTLLELHFRLSKEVRKSNTSATIELQTELDYDLPYYYSLEETAEAISYVISRYCDNYECEDRHLWIDSDAVIGNLELAKLIQIAAKRKLTVEWEITVDYYGYDIKKVADSYYRIIDKNDFEKSIQLGYIKTEFQEQARIASNAIPPNEAMSLYEMANEFRNDPELLFEHIDMGTEIERYRLLFWQPLMEFMTPLDYENPKFFREEWTQISDAAHEMLISPDEVLKYKVTELCTVKDIILFKRFFTFISYAQQIFIESHQDDMKTVAKSIAPTFRREALLQLLKVCVGSQEKAEELINLYTWDGNGFLDIQSTPIIELNRNQYILVPYVLATSNLIRNVIVKERKNESQKTNSNGDNEPLERFTTALFDYRKDIFSYRAGCKFKYNGESGEIDLVAWSDKHLYLIECKNSILPTSPFELRTTYDYIRKAEKQLDLSKSALTDVKERKQLFNNWDIPTRDYEIHTLIVLGNRIFTAPNGFRHSVRYIHELYMVITGGDIHSSFGEWRYWKNTEFLEDDLIRFISEDDPLSNDFLEAMSPYKMILSAGRNKIERETYSLNIMRHWELDDRNLVNLSTDIHMRKREEYEKNHNEIIEQIIEQNSKGAK